MSFSLSSLLQARSRLRANEQQLRSRKAAFGRSGYPCRCVWRGFAVQITRTTPLRRITLHFTQIFFTEARTFTASSSRRKRPENRFPSVRTPYRGSRRRGLPGTKGARLITAALHHVKVLLAGRRAGHRGAPAT